MTRAAQWLWRRTEHDNDEARTELGKLHLQSPEVDRLGQELREAQRRNNFSPMVAAAIARVAREEPAP